MIITGSIAATTHTPCQKRVATTMATTRPVAAAPTALTTWLRRQCPPAFPSRTPMRRQYTTMPACDRVNAVNTPTA